jgi:cold shock CspA family protein
MDTTESIGVVVKWVGERGFGFLKIAGAPRDTYFHEDCVISDELPSVGDRVAFVLHSDGRRSRAINVRRLTPSREVHG